MDYKVITQNLILLNGNPQTKIELTMTFDDWFALENSDVWFELGRFLDNRKKQHTPKYTDCDQV